VIELLFARGEDEICPAIHTFQNTVLKIRHGTILKEERRRIAILSACWNASVGPGKPPWALGTRSTRLFDFPATLLPVPFASQRLLDAQFLPRLQIERMPLDLFDDVFLLHLPLKAPEGVFQGFTFLEPYFSQTINTSKPIKKFRAPGECTACAPIKN
jgi:hypothetical protein